MKITRFFSVLVTLLMIMILPSTAQAQSYTDVSDKNEYYEAVEALSALGIIKGYDEGVFKPDGKITRAEFATIVMRVTGMGFSENARVNTIFKDVTAEHWASGSISDAYNAGIINGVSLTTDKNGNIISGVFEPESEVTYEQAVKMIVCALGYKRKAEAMVTKGTNPFPTGFNMVASQENILEGTVKTQGGASRGTVSRLVYNSLTVNLMDQTSYGTNESFEKIPTQSLLYSKLKAIKVTAKIDKVSLEPTNNKISLSITKGGYDNVAVRNGVYTYPTSLYNIKRGNVSVAGMQGLTVTAFVDISQTGEETLIAAFSKSGKNTELYITPDLYQGMENKTIRYYKNSDATTVNTSSKIEVPFSVYLNMVNVATEEKEGNAISEIQKYTAINGVGGIATNDVAYRFVDTDTNGYYDTLFVDNTASFVVDKIDKTDFAIYKDNSSNVFNSSILWNVAGEYDFSPLYLDKSRDNVSYFLHDSKGKQIDFSEIDKGDVLSVTQSLEDGYKYYDIEVSNSKTIEGTVTQVEDIKVKGTSSYITYYTINSKKYRLNREASSPDIEAGGSGVFKITADDKIIAFSYEGGTRNLAAAIQLARAGGPFSNSVQLQICTSRGELVAYELAERYVVNGESFSYSANTIDKVMKQLVGVKGQIISYELNSKNEIKKLYYTSDGLKKLDMDYRLTDNTVTPAEYKYASNKLGSAYLKKDTAFVAVKGSDITNSKNYSMVSENAFTDGNSYKCYTLADENREALFVLLNSFTTQPSYDSIPMIITSQATVKFNDSIRTKLTGYVGNKLVSYVLADDDNLTFVDMSGEVDGRAFTTLSLSNLISAIDTATKNKADAQAEVVKAKADLQKAQEDLKAASSSKGLAETALSEATANLNKAKADLDNAKLSNDQQLVLNETYTASLNQATANVNTLTEKKAVLDTSVESAQSIVNDAQAIVNSANTALQAATNELDIAEANNEQLKKAIEDTKNKVAVDTLELGTTKTKIDDLTKENKDLTQKIETVNKEITLNDTLVLDAKTKLDATKKIQKTLEDGLLKAEADLKNVEIDDPKYKALSDAVETASDKLLLAKADTLSKQKAYDAVAKISADKKADVQKVQLVIAQNIKTIATYTEKQIALETSIKVATESQGTSNSQFETSTGGLKVLQDNVIAKQADYDKVRSEFDIKNNELKGILTSQQEFILTFNKANEDLKTIIENKPVSQTVSTDELTKKVAELEIIVTEKKTLLDSAVAVGNSLQADFEAKTLVSTKAESKVATAETELTNAKANYNNSNVNSFEISKRLDTNDIIQFVLNSNDEIISYRHLVKNYDNNMYMLVSQGTAQETKEQVNANLVAYPTNRTVAPHIIDDKDVFNGKVVRKDLKMYGFGVGGRLCNSSARAVELFATSASATTPSAAVNSTVDTSYNPNLYAYMVGSTYNTAKSTTMDAVKSYKTVSSSNPSDTVIVNALNKADDFVYIFKYDGDNYCTLVIDTLSNNNR